MGLNMGVRSVYKGDADGGDDIGEGLSLGFKADYALSATSGLALGLNNYYILTIKPIRVEIYI